VTTTSTKPITASVTTTTGWRAVLPIHPAASLFPPMTPDELRELGEDIKKNGLKLPIAITGDGKLLDGRNRLDAMEAAGVEFKFKRTTNGGPIHIDIAGGDLSFAQVVTSDPVAFVISTNICRHHLHLTVEQRRNLIAELLKTDPSKSDRQIAATEKASPTTVSTVRRQMETKGEVSKLDTRIDAKGVKQPATKLVRAPSPTHVCWQCGRRGEIGEVQEHRYPAYDDTDVWLHDACIAAFERHQREAAAAPPRADVGPDSVAEAARLRVCIETLQVEKRCLELKVEGLERELADLKAASQTKQGPPIDESPEGYWQRSLTALADEVIVRTTCHWPDGWKTFGVPPHLLEHAMRAMTTWCDLVKQLSTQPIPPPPMPQLSAAPAPDDGLGIPEFLDRSKQTGATP